MHRIICEGDFRRADFIETLLDMLRAVRERRQARAELPKQDVKQRDRREITKGRR